MELPLTFSGNALHFFFFLAALKDVTKAEGA